MKFYKALFLGVALFLLMGFIDENRIRIPGKMMIIAPFEVTFEGRWQEIDGKIDYKSIPRANATSVVCNKTAMTCTENTACLITDKDDSSTGGLPVLCIRKKIYGIVEWSEDVIRATQSEKKIRPGDYELIIILKTKSANRSYTSKLPEAAVNTKETWMLQ